MDKRIVRCLDDLRKSGLLSDIGGDWNLPDDCSLKCDSRTVGPGDIFACVPGLHSDGHDFIGDVLTKGAGGLIIQRPIYGLQIPWIEVKDVRAAMGFIAASLYNEPTFALKMYGITGTQGKSTTNYIVRNILESAGLKCGMLGTSSYYDGKKEFPADRTTPESAVVQSYLKSMVENGCHACTMECSSHGIVQGRLCGCKYDGAVFTNLTPEHLDFHHTMENYFAAKCALFKSYLKPEGKIAPNVSNEYGRRVAQMFPSSITWGVEVPARVQGLNLDLETSKSEFDLTFDGVKVARVNLPLIGKFNVENALGAAAICLATGIDGESVVKGLEKLPQVPGRVEKLMLENGVCVIIDYAHTADSLRTLLLSIHPLVKGRLACVFGHGGDRFKPHRRLLGRAAAEFANRIFVTEDNSRFEDPVAIALEIAAGIKEVRTGGWSIEIPRSLAIEKALDWCKRGDVLVISGKGAEPYIEKNGTKYQYSDKAAVENWAHKKGLCVS